MASLQFGEGGGLNPHEIVFQAGSETASAKIAVAISLYNYGNYIIDCLDSVARQSLTPLDLVIVDDCSADESVELVNGWLFRNSSRFGRSALLHHTTNRGLAAARNAGWEHSLSEYVFVLDADNMLYPRCLEALSAALDNCSASFAYCYLEMFGEVSRLQNTKVWDPNALYRSNTIDAMVLHRRSTLAEVGGYSTDMPAMGWEDYELWFKIAKTGGWGVLVPEILARYRVHSGSMLHQTTNPNAYKLTRYLREKHPTFFR
jgi:glycosyltransferase involved in cell wall biosynthesis